LWWASPSLLRHCGSGSRPVGHFVLQRSPSAASVPCVAKSQRFATGSKAFPFAHPGDILLVAQVDRLSRLTAEDWERLKADLTARRMRVVALDLPTSWMMATKAGDEFTGRMFEAINGMLLDMLAAVARKDYDDRRRRQAQGQAKAKAEGRYKGRPEDAERNDGIGRMLAVGQSWATGCSRATIAKIAKRLKEAP
jgi:DNA invertase Pin-like site-specific DNA recombinase